MNEPLRRFDWLAFFRRFIFIVTMTTWLVIERVKEHDRTGVVLFAGIGYVIGPVMAYLHTRNYNLLFMAGIIRAVKRRFPGSRRSG